MEYIEELSNSELMNWKEKASRFCLYQERCLFDIERWLYKMKIATHYHEEIINFLASQDFFSQLRFVEEYVSGKVSIKKWGRLKIVNGLREKEVSAEFIKIGLNQIDERIYLSNLEKLIMKKKEGKIGREKMIRYLLSKGYENDLIVEKL